MRGIMEFDDYNYNQYNDYVLLEEPGVRERKKILKERLEMEIVAANLDKNKQATESELWEAPVTY